MLRIPQRTTKLFPCAVRGKRVYYEFGAEETAENVLSVSNHNHQPVVFFLQKGPSVV